MLKRLLAKPLTVEQTQTIVETKLNWVLSHSEPVQVWLVGSAARGEMTDGSDVDLILVFPDEKKLLEGRKTLHITRPLAGDWPQDLIYLTQMGWLEGQAKGGGLVWLAQTEGKLLFDRSKNGTERLPP